MENLAANSGDADGFGVELAPGRPAPPPDLRVELGAQRNAPGVAADGDAGPFREAGDSRPRTGQQPGYVVDVYLGADVREIRLERHGQQRLDGLGDARHSPGLKLVREPFGPPTQTPLPLLVPHRERRPIGHALDVGGVERLGRRSDDEHAQGPSLAVALVVHVAPGGRAGIGSGATAAAA